MSIDRSDENCYDVVITHNDQEIRFDASYYKPNRSKKREPKEREDPFEHFNIFIASLNSNEIEDKFFEIYEEIKEMFISVNNIHFLKTFLQEKTEEIYSMVTYRDVFSWLINSSSVEPPSDVKSHYDDKDPDITYVKTDYWQLLALSLMLRPMIPIWAVTFTRLKEINLRENFMFEFLVNTEILETQAMDKLNTYVIKTSKQIWATEINGYSTAAALSGLGEEEFTENALAGSIIKKLAVGELNRDPITKECGRGNLISNVYRLILNNAGNLDKRQGIGRVNNKVDKSKKDSKEENSSILDGYKEKRKQSDGDKVTSSFLAERGEFNARKLEPEIDINLVRDCIDCAFQREIDHIKDGQGTLIKYVIDPVIEAKSVNLLNKRALIITMGVCQAVLIHRGFMDLAMIVSGVSDHEEEEEGLNIFEEEIMNFGDFDSNNLALNKQLSDILLEQYPFKKEPGSKQQSVKSTNPGLIVVEKMAKEFVNENWIQYIPERYKYPQYLWRTPGNIRDSLAKLIILRNDPDALTKYNIKI